MRTTIVALALGCFAAWLAYHAIASLRCGEAEAHSFRYARSTRPIMFWVTVLGQITFALAFLYLVYVQLRT